MHIKKNKKTKHDYVSTTIHVKSICAKLRYLTEHLGEKVKYLLEKERVRDYVSTLSRYKYKTPFLRGGQRNTLVSFLKENM